MLFFWIHQGLALLSSASVCKPGKTPMKAFLPFPLLTSGVPDRVRRPPDHLPNVLLPPSLHLLSEIRLHQQQALGRTVSVGFLFCFIFRGSVALSRLAQIPPQHGTH